MVKVLTLDQLQRRGFVLVNRYCLYQEFEEFVNLLLLCYIKTRMLRKLLFSLLGITWVSPLLVWDTIFGWKDSFVGKMQRKAGK